MFVGLNSTTHLLKMVMGHETIFASVFGRMGVERSIASAFGLRDEERGSDVNSVYIDRIRIS